MTVPEEIQELVKRFDRNIETYCSGQYNETQLRREFIDPFFEALGWDVHNKQGFAEPYKEVIHEDVVKIGSATKAPDYSFRIGGILSDTKCSFGKESLSQRDPRSGGFAALRGGTKW